MDLKAKINSRKTFAIISHPDAGKTTLTEKLLLFGGAIREAGSVKGRKADKDENYAVLLLDEWKEKWLSDRYDIEFSMQPKVGQ